MDCFEAMPSLPTLSWKPLAAIAAGAAALLAVMVVLLKRDLHSLGQSCEGLGCSVYKSHG